ncbi:HTH domain-containing protein, partial [Clostridium perfringens]
MRAIERREKIIKLIIEKNRAIKGTELADLFGVTRQIIVKDIAILRAAGKNIIATPDGYIYN